MPSNSEYAQRQFRTDKSEAADKANTERELRALKGKVKELEDKVSSLSHELSLRKVIGENTRGFS